MFFFIGQPQTTNGMMPFLVIVDVLLALILYGNCAGADLQVQSLDLNTLLNNLKYLNRELSYDEDRYGLLNQRSPLTLSSSRLRESETNPSNYRHKHSRQSINNQRHSDGEQLKVALQKALSFLPSTNKRSQSNRSLKSKPFNGYKTKNNYNQLDISSQTPLVYVNLWKNGENTVNDNYRNKLNVQYKYHNGDSNVLKTFKSVLNLAKEPSKIYHKDKKHNNLALQELFRDKDSSHRGVQPHNLLPTAESPRDVSPNRVNLNNYSKFILLLKPQALKNEKNLNGIYNLVSNLVSTLGSKEKNAKTFDLERYLSENNLLSRRAVYDEQEEVPKRIRGSGGGGGRTSIPYASGRASFYEKD